MALTEHTKLHADEAMRIRMEDRERARIDEILLRNAYLKEGRTEGRAEGKAEGKAEGIVEGKIEGRTEGRAEKTKEIARTLKNEGMSDEFIMKTTGLAPEELKLCLKTV